MDNVGREVLRADNHDAADIVCDESERSSPRCAHAPDILAENTSVGCLADSWRTSRTFIRCSACGGWIKLCRDLGQGLGHERAPALLA